MSLTPEEKKRIIEEERLRAKIRREEGYFMKPKLPPAPHRYHSRLPAIGWVAIIAIGLLIFSCNVVTQQTT